MTAVYKVYNDGRHNIGYLYRPGSAEEKKQRDPDYRDESFDFLFLAAARNNLRGAAREQFLYDELAAEFGESEDLEFYIIDSLRRKLHSVHERRKRVKRKAAITFNRLNISHDVYFFTQTYSDAKFDECLFRRRLKDTFKNFANRYGWKILGSFEYGEEGRLHFHGIVFVPRGNLHGSIFKVNRYSDKKGWRSVFYHSYFERRFGRNEMDKVYGGTEAVIDYVLKYVVKSNEKIFSSRGLPTELLMIADKEKFACVLKNYINKYVVWDSVKLPEYCIYEQKLLLERFRTS